MLLPALLAGLSSVALGQTNCPIGWTPFQNSCYRLLYHKVYYFDAMTSCAELIPGMQTTLASIHSAEENAFVMTLVRGYDYVWIGFNDITNENSFQWTDGSSVVYTNWAPGQPDNLNDSDCVFMLPDGTWDDSKCETAGVALHARQGVCVQDPQ